MQLQFSIDKSSVSKGKVNTSSGGVGGTRSLGAWEVANRVYREQGVLAFWRGERIVLILTMFILCEFLRKILFGGG